MKAFMPTNLYVKVAENTPFKAGSMQKVKYVGFFSIQDTDDVIIEQYYHRNFAQTRKIKMCELKKIDGFGNVTDDNIELYNKIFN